MPEYLTSGNECQSTQEPDLDETGLDDFSSRELRVRSTKQPPQDSIPNHSKGRCKAKEEVLWDSPRRRSKVKGATVTHSAGTFALAVPRA